MYINMYNRHLLILYKTDKGKLKLVNTRSLLVILQITGIHILNIVPYNALLSVDYWYYINLNTRKSSTI